MKNLRIIVKNRVKVLLLAGLGLVMSGESWGQTSYTSTAASGAWNTSRWNNSADAAPYTSTFTANNAVSFTSGTYAIGGMGTSTNVGNVTVASGVTVNFTAGSTYATGGAVRTFDIGSGGLFDFNSQAISTAAGTGFIKSGAGVFATGGGAFTGGFTLNAGTVIVRGTTGLGSGTGNILNLNGGTIASNSTRDLANTRFPGGINIGGNVQFGEMATVVSLANSTADLRFANNVSLGNANRTLTLGNGGTMTFSAIISNTGSNGITFTANNNGTGRFDITNSANTFSGPVNINGNGTGAAEVRFTADASLGNSGNTININGGRLATSNSASYTLTAGRGIQVGNTANTAISTPGTGTLTYNGVIADLTGATPGAWAKQGGGTLVLGGVSTYTGATAINNGILQLSTGNDRLPTGTVLSLGQASSTNLGTFDLNGRNQTIAGLASVTGTNASGSAWNTITSSTAATLTINSSTNTTYSLATAANSGRITGAVSIVKSGAGTLTLGDVTNNTYTGTTTINGGFIATSGEAAFGANPGSFTAAQITLNGGGIQTSTGDITFNSNRGITLGASGGTFDCTSPRQITLTNVVAGTGSLTKTGTGTLTMTGVHTYSGGTIVNAGTLTLSGASNTLGSNTCPLTINNSATVNINTTVTVGSLSGNSGSAVCNVNTGSNPLIINQTTNTTYPGDFSGGGTFTKSGTGTLILTGGYSGNGNINVNNGTLLVNSTISTGATFTVSGTGILGGNGTITRTINVQNGGTITGGNAGNVARLNVNNSSLSSMDWQGGSKYRFDIGNVSASVAGTDYDQIALTGNLFISATSGTPMTIEIAGNPTGWNSTNTYSWTIATAAGGVTSFAANKFNFNTTNFAATIGGSFSISQSGNDVILTYTPSVVPTVNLSVSANAATASEASATVVTVTATASAAVSGNQTVSLGVSGTGITAGDYTLSNATLTILNGQTTGTVTFTIQNDAVIEGTETATLTISSPSSGISLGGTTTQNVSITDNDFATVNLSVSANAATAAEASATVVTVTANLSATAPTNQTVDLAVTGTGITAGDYTLSATTITIVAGQTTGTVTFTIVNDAAIEATETATLTISNPSSALVLGSTTTATVTITDNDFPAVNLSVSANAATASEASATVVTVTATASQAVSGNQTVSLGVSGTNITAGDYNLSNTIITILNGQTTGTVTFTVVDDATVDGTETATLTISTPSSGLTLGSTLTQNVVITDNDFAPPTVVVNKYNSNTNVAELLVVDNNLNVQGLTIKDFSSNNANDNGGKYTFTTNALWSSLPSGTLIIVRNDGSSADISTADGNFTIDVGLTNTTYFTSGGGTYDPGGNDMVMIKSNATSGTANNIHTLAGGSNGAQYSGIASGYRQRIATTSDFVFVGNSNSTIGDYNLDAQVQTATTGITFGLPNNTTNQTYICNLRGGNPAPTTSVTNSNITFPTVGDVNITANWSNPSSGGGARRIVVVRQTSTTGVAPTNGIDYNTSTNFASPAAVNGITGAGNVVVFDGTATSVAVTGLSCGTNYTFDIYEYNGVEFCAVYRATPGTNAQATTSTSCTTGITLAASSATVAENVGTVTLTLQISNPSVTLPTTIQVAITGGSGTAADLSPTYTTQTVTFPANSSANQTLTITVNDDALAEQVETLVFSLQSISGGQGTPTIGTPNTYTLTITDNDVPNIVINEIHYNPNDAGGFTDANYEFVELYNAGATSVDISGYSIADAFVYTFPASSSMTAGQYILLAVNSSTYPGSIQWTSGSLNNAGEAITLKTYGNLTVDAVTYSPSSPWPTTANGSGNTAALINSSSDNSLGASWAASCQINGTPGASNAFPCPTITVVYSRGTGIAATDAIWSTTPTGTAQTIASLGGFQPSIDVVVQNTDQVQFSSSADMKNLTVQSGARIWRNNGVSMSYLNIYGTTIQFDGTVGNGSTIDALGLNIEGVTTTLQGNGTINLARIRKTDDATNATSTLNIASNLSLLFNGAALYNNSNSTLNINLNSGRTLNIPNGSVNIDGTSGINTSERGGTFTFFGTLTVGDTLFNTTDNATSTATIAIPSGGVVNARLVITDLSNPRSVFSIASGGKLNVTEALILKSGAFSPANGTVTLKSTSASNAAYVDNFSTGNSGTCSASITVERMVIGGNGYRYISSPVNGNSVSDIADDFSIVGASGHPSQTYTSPWPNVWQYDETSTNPSMSYGWTSYTAGGNTLDRMTGYAAIMPATTLDFNGTVLSGNQSKAITYTNSGSPLSDGFNLVGNSYSSPIDWQYAYDNLNVGNIASTVYCFANSGGYAGQYATYNASGGAAINGGSRYIASSQGFFVKATSGTNGFFRLNNASRIASTSTPFFKQAETEQRFVRLEINQNGNLDELLIMETSEGEENYSDIHDALKMKSQNNSLPTFYSITKANEELSINALPDFSLGQVIPLGLKAGADGIKSIKAKEINNLASLNIILEDRKLNKTVNLSTNPEYNFIQSVQDSATGRFFLRLAEPNTEMQTKELLTSIFISNNTFNIHAVGNIQNQFSYQIVDAMGRLVSDGNSVLIDGKAEIEIQNQNSGLYIMSISVDGQQFHAKGFIK